MSFVHSFENYRPPARSDEPWTGAVPEQATDDEGTDLIELTEIPLDPVDDDPMAPALRDLTVEDATLEDAWFRFRFIDGNGGLSPASSWVHSPAASGLASLITAEELGQSINRDLAGDDAAEAVVIEVSAVCRTKAGQVFSLVEDDVITFDGPGTAKIILPEVPVVSVASVADVNDEVLDTNDWMLDTRYGILYRRGGRWTKGDQNFTVTYTHGYADGELPDDVRLVALSLAQRIYLQGPVLFEIMGNHHVRYSGPAMELTKTELAILRRHNPNL